MKKPIMFSLLILCLAVVARAQDTCGVWVRVEHLWGFGLENIHFFFWKDSLGIPDSVFVPRACPPNLHWGTSAGWELLTAEDTVIATNIPLIEADSNAKRLLNPDTACCHWEVKRVPKEISFRWDTWDSDNPIWDTLSWEDEYYKVYEPCK